MTNKKILVEIDEAENTRWVTVDGKHYPFSGKDRVTMIELELSAATTFVDDPEEYKRFKSP